MKIRGQGLPINTVILIAIGLLILILLVVFSLGGFKGLGAAKPQSFSAFQADCQSACSALQSSNSISAALTAAQGYGGYCSLTYTSETGSVYHCYNPNVKGVCQFTLSNGTSACIGIGNSCQVGVGQQCG
jgi:hypothetical protein